MSSPSSKSQKTLPCFLFHLTLFFGRAAIKQRLYHFYSLEYLLLIRIDQFLNVDRNNIFGLLFLLRAIRLHRIVLNRGVTWDCMCLERSFCLLWTLQVGRTAKASWVLSPTVNSRAQTVRQEGLRDWMGARPGGELTQLLNNAVPWWEVEVWGKTILEDFDLY